MHFPATNLDHGPCQFNAQLFKPRLLYVEIGDFERKGVIANLVQLSFASGGWCFRAHIFPHLNVHIADVKPAALDGQIVDIGNIVQTGAVFLLGGTVCFMSQKLLVK